MAWHWAGLKFFCYEGGGYTRAMVELLLIPTTEEGKLSEVGSYFGRETNPRLIKATYEFRLNQEFETLQATNVLFLCFPRSVGNQFAFALIPKSVCPAASTDLARK